MKKLKEELKYGKKGITLISLVVTIIVLLILAGVTIATLTGDNGILTRATEAKNKTEEAQEKESLELAVISSQMEDVNTLEITEEKLSDAIKQQFGNNKDFSITNNGDGSFLVSMNDTQRMYYIDETGEIIDQSKMLKISTANELKAFRDDVNNGNTYEGWYVYLTNDITLDINEEWEPIGLYPMENSTPDDESNKPFSGIFDGKGYEINRIYINTTNKGQGLFGFVTNGLIKNTGIGENCSITGGNATAGLIGYAYESTTIKNCYNISAINGKDGVGGITGVNNKNCNIEQCSNFGNIIGTTMVGGITGQNNNSIVDSCYNIEEIQGDGENIGGIIGLNLYNGIVENCYNIGNLIGDRQSTGGIIGRNTDNGRMNNCYFLENLVGGENGNILEGSVVKTSEEMKLLTSLLGSAFKNDTNNINNGYPILQWQ